MRGTNILITCLMILVALVALVMLANNLILQKAVPSLGDYIASSTQAFNNESSTTLNSAGAVLGGISTLDISAPQGTIHVRVASTTIDREKGLGDRESMSADEGMLFVFETPGSYAFWMKDMRFALDMVWIGADKKVAGVTTDISVDSYPETFSPPYSILYVLELNSGAARKFGLSAGTQLSF